MNLSSKNGLRDLDRGLALHHTMQLIEKSWESFDQARPTQPGISMEIETLLDQPLPEEGTDAIAVLDAAEDILDQSHSPTRPRFFAFVGSSGLEMGVLADLLATSYDVNLATYAGAANLVEQQALRWIAALIGFPGGYGAFTSGGMLSNLTALMAAREYALPGNRETGIRQDVAVYVSRDAHTSIARAVEVLGLGNHRLRDIPIDAQRRMDSTKLAEILQQDIEAGITPIAIVISAGTTLAGAVDPIAEVATIAEQHGVWLHIDGAYGGAAAATPTTTALFDGLSRANSLTIDAHKWLFLPKPCGVLLVRDQAWLTAAFAHDAAYIPDEPDVFNPVNWTLEYSRPFRALKVWLAMKTYGAGAFRRAIQRNLDQAQLCAELIKRSDVLELLLEPQLSVVLFRHIATVESLNTHNREIARRLQATGQVYVAEATVEEEVWLRVCFVNYRTEDNDVKALIQIVEEVGASVVAEPDPI